MKIKIKLGGDPKDLGAPVAVEVRNDKLVTVWDGAIRLGDKREVPIAEAGWYHVRLILPSGSATRSVDLRSSRRGEVYFDKESGLMAKVEHRTIDLSSGQELTEERIITEYQKIDGIPMPKKVLVQRDGKKFMDAEVTEVEISIDGPGASLHVSRMGVEVNDIGVVGIQRGA